MGNLLRQAANHLRTATAGIAADDLEGAFQLAYDACRKTCLALVLARGVRPRGEAGHLLTFKAAAVIAHAFGAKRLVLDAGNLRFVRHGTEYRAESVGTEDVEDAIALGQELIDTLAPRVVQLVRAPG